MNLKEWKKMLSQYGEAFINDMRETQKLIEQGTTAYSLFKVCSNTK